MLKTLKKIRNETISPPKIGEILEGKVISKERGSLFLDLGAKGIGIITGQEFLNAKETLKSLKPGDSLSGKLVELENEDGYRELSLTQAYQELAWQELLQAKTEEKTFEVIVKGANKGGLIAQIKGVAGFLPTSQLLPEHYPKIDGADPAKIAQALQKIVGEKIKVKIFSVNPKEEKLILTEKIRRLEKDKQEIIHYNIGDVVEGEISGVTSFGAFLKFGENLEGLIPAEAISLRDEKPETILKIGDKIKAEINKIEDERIYLSPCIK